MSDPQPMPLWMIPLFPVAFVAFWLFVVGLLSALGGWAALGRLYRDPGNAARGNSLELPGASVGMRRGGVPFPVSYNRCVAIRLSAPGIHLRVMAVFRFRHPPLLIPWTQVERMEPGSLFGWRTLAIHPRGTATRIRLYGGAAGVVQEAWMRRAGGAAPSPASA